MKCIKRPFYFFLPLPKHFPNLMTHLQPFPHTLFLCSQVLCSEVNLIPRVSLREYERPWDLDCSKVISLTPNGQLDECWIQAHLLTANQTAHVIFGLSAVPIKFTLVQTGMRGTVQRQLLRKRRTSNTLHDLRCKNS